MKKKSLILATLIILSMIVIAASLRETKKADRLAPNSITAVQSTDNCTDSDLLTLAETYDPACCAACAQQLNGCIMGCYYTNPQCYSNCQANMQACLETCEVD